MTKLHQDHLPPATLLAAVAVGAAMWLLLGLVVAWLWGVVLP